MDSRDNFLVGFIEYVKNIDDDYLIGVANKGIFLRAQKELKNNSDILIEIQDSSVKCILPDGNICILTDNIKDFKCTCPSRSLCKHAVISLLFIRENLETIFGSTAEGEREDDIKPPNFKNVLELDERRIEKLVGERAFKNILKRLEFGVSAEIEEGSLLTIKFPEEGITVRFTDRDPVEDSICSCKNTKFCSHRAEAVINYKIYKGILTVEDLLKTEDALEEVLREDTSMVLKDVKDITSEILLTGLSRLPETLKDRLEEAAVICHSAELVNLEKDIRDIKTELELYFSKNASFLRAALRLKVVKLYNTARAIESLKDNKKVKTLIGEFKSSYYDIPPVDLHGMGLGLWNSKSGFEGITCYFINEKLKKWLTFTVSRPTYYEDSRVKRTNMLKQRAPWSLDTTMEELSKSHIRLVYGKMNDEGRLSSSEESRGTILKGTDIKKLDLEVFLFDDWLKLLEKVSENAAGGFMEKEENSNLFLLKAGSFGKGQFDTINQRFSLPLYDGESRKISILLEYSSVNRRIIENLEALERSTILPGIILGKVYLRDGEVRVVPVAGYYENGRIINLSC